MSNKIPKFVSENLDTYENGEVGIKKDAPKWAKQEYKEVMENLSIHNNK